MLDATTTDPAIAAMNARSAIASAIADCKTWDAINAKLPRIRKQYPTLSIWGLGPIKIGAYGHVSICDKMHNVLVDVPCPNAKPGSSTW